VSNCRSCGAEIEWAVTPNDKPIPLDTGVRADGNIRLDVRLDGSRVAIIDSTNGDRVSHFATCPNAASHRNR
jgi:hypothetical protein